MEELETLFGNAEHYLIRLDFFEEPNLFWTDGRVIIKCKNLFENTVDEKMLFELIKNGEGVVFERSWLGIKTNVYNSLNPNIFFRINGKTEKKTVESVKNYITKTIENKYSDKNELKLIHDLEFGVKNYRSKIFLKKNEKNIEKKVVLVQSKYIEHIDECMDNSYFLREDNSIASFKKGLYFNHDSEQRLSYFDALIMPLKDSVNKNLMKSIKTVIGKHYKYFK